MVNTELSIGYLGIKNIDMKNEQRKNGLKGHQ